MLEHIHVYTSLDSVMSLHPSAGIILTGDFNRMPDAILKRNYKLKQIVKGATRNNASLDLIYTNMSDVYYEPTVEPALGLSDHQVVVCQPKPSFALQPAKKHTRVIRRFLPQAKAAFKDELQEVDWTPLYQCIPCSDKYDQFETTIISLVDRHFQWKQVTRVESEKPWVTDRFRDLIKKETACMARRKPAPV